MPHRLTIRRVARRELEAAANWYSERNQELSNRFVEAVAATVNRVRASPGQFPILDGDIRAAGVGGFPYVIYFRWLENRVVVIAVLHGARDPAIWMNRE